MTEHRADTVKDIRDVPQVSLKYYKSHILPRSSYHDYLDAISEALQENGILVDDKGELRWKAFPNDPKRSRKSEDETFKHMETITAAIVTAALGMFSDGPPPTTVMECRPTQTALSEGRNGVFKSDGHYALLKSRRSDYVEDATSTKPIKPPDLINKISHKLACDRPALEEYKKGDTLWDQNDAMYVDPTRRFMFGTTIENTTTRFWFFSRAIVLVSESFNFIKDYTHLIHYVLSLSFATAEELGYDMSVTRVAYPLAAKPSELTIQYDYRTGGGTYRTVECLSSFRASGLLSRATRVWTVCQLNDKKHRKCALKDVWVPSSAQTELEIQQEIFKSIEENHPEIEREYRKKYFMEILECEVVRTSDDCDDDMPAFVQEQLEIIGCLPLHMQETASVSRTMPRSIICTPTGASLANPDADNILQPPRLYKGRKHVRVVFADVGTPLSDIQQPRVLFNALSHALKGSTVFITSTWDIMSTVTSLRAILSNGMGKISDLEYAKKFLSQDPANDPKTGTPIYMSVEVQATEYIFIRKTEQPLPSDDDEPLPQNTLPLFLHNYLHDIESLFWIGLHLLFSTIPASYPEDLPARNKQSVLFNDFFPHYLAGSAARRRFIEHADFKTTEEVPPDEYRNTVRRLFRLRYILAYHYGQVENLSSFPQHEHFSQVYSTSKRGGDLFRAFEAVAKGAYSGDTQPLFPNKVMDIAGTQHPLVSREPSDDGDRDDDQTYIFDNLQHAEGLEDDEEPPSKVHRKNGKTRENAAGGSRHTSVKQQSVEGTHSGEKRKRLL
ncbi:hypothetical protein EDD18DRAFT_1363656 [Armillaria luteobubalina]|uniref:Fungal-type protein kinase domain-containing protein n=1 Tax=Armillaria luteobubalina TaxID=153913 RepID=A0AA39PAU3_9AGAR|nr:hypothetical protein EDD18DRAFT_1363656 [Armillaria luteobubalina]